MFQPLDDKQRVVPLVPNIVPLAVTYDATISSAHDITLDVQTTLIEVSAISQGVFLRYQASASSSAFDEYIAAGSTRHYIIPEDVTVISVIEEAASAHVVVIEK